MGDLKIRVINNMKKPTHFMLYQEDINLNVKNFKVGAWKHDNLAANATYNTVLPQNIQVCSRDMSDSGTIVTKKVKVDYNNVLEVFTNTNALDIRHNMDKTSTENTIDVLNLCPITKEILVEKDGRPLFMCEIRPEYKLNFAINPKIFIGLCDFEISGDFFDAASISKKLEIDYEGQAYLTITLLENQSSGKVTIDYSFEKFEG